MYQQDQADSYSAQLSAFNGQYPPARGLTTGQYASSSALTLNPQYAIAGGSMFNQYHPPTATAMQPIPVRPAVAQYASSPHSVSQMHHQQVADWLQTPLSMPSGSNNTSGSLAPDPARLQCGMEIAQRLWLTMPRRPGVQILGRPETTSMVINMSQVFPI